MKRRPGARPEINCQALPAFDFTNLESVRRAFRGTKPIGFNQSWRDEEEIHFAPGQVQLGWHPGSLLIFAELWDMDIFNNASQPKDRTWEMGDAFEIFLKPAGAQSYVELHVTPNNHRLHLQYGDGEIERARASGCLEELLRPDAAFQSRVWIEPGQWHVFAVVPALTVQGSDASLEHTQWHFSFGRYDYTRGVNKPVISSTSPHCQPDFHRQAEWGRLTFKPGSQTV